MEKNWILKSQGDVETVKELSESLDISRSLAILLYQRGIRNFEEARSFFRPTLDDLHDPFLMKDMAPAVQRIAQALDNKEKILVYGDYDVDGTTSVALMYTFLKSIHDSLDFYIPDRYHEGYGISMTGIEYARETGVNLIIALDCGIKAVDKVKHASHHGIDFIICDHHNPADEIPPAVAVLDPKRRDCTYPDKDLSGCGVGFKLIQGYAQEYDIPFESLVPYLDLVSVSIASDIVSVTGENRIMAHFGLKELNKNPRTGLAAIIELSGITDKRITIDDVVFKIGPRINAAGRMESGKSAVHLLISDDKEGAKVMGDKVDNYNSDRRNVDSTITQEALDLINGDPELQKKKTTVLFNPKWHKGVIGIVASRLIDTWYRPTVILTESNGFATGSARSVFGFDLYQAVENCSDLLVNFGGHKYAAGLTLKVENIPKFQKRFEEFVSETISPDQMIPIVEIDTEISLSEITPKFFRILRQFEPFGPDNMHPVFLTENVVDNGMGKQVGNHCDHLKLSLVQEEDPYKVYPAIAFQMGNRFKKVQNGQGFDVCYMVEENEFMGRKNLQLNIRDMKFD